MSKVGKYTSGLSPDPNSTRSKKRANRGFRTLDLDSRKHRRKNKRMAIACFISGKPYKPGDKAPNAVGKMEFSAGGSVRFY